MLEQILTDFKTENKMTKEEKIKEAYGSKFESLEQHIDSNGWINEYNSYRSEFESLEFDYKTNSMRPLELKGIENNNGWVKITVMKDLPDKLVLCFCRNKLGHIFTTQLSKSKTNFSYIVRNDITHYQKVVFPEHPIY